MTDNIFRLPPGQRYEYRARVWDSHGPGPWSDVAQVGMDDLPSTFSLGLESLESAETPNAAVQLSTPPALYALSTTQRQVELEWSDIPGATSYELWRCSDTKAQKERAKAGLAITGAALTIVGGWKALLGVKATATAIKLGLPVKKIAVVALKTVGVEIGEGVVEEYVKEFFLETVQSSCLGYWEPLTGYNVRMETYTDANYIVGTTYTDDVSPQRYYYYRVRGQHRNGPGPWSQGNCI